MIPSQFKPFVDTFDEFIRTYAYTRQEFFFVAKPQMCLGLPPHLQDQETISLVLGARFRYAKIEYAPGMAQLVFQTTFNRGPWVTVRVPLSAILLYEVRQVPNQPSEGAVGAWWAVFSGGLQASPRRRTLLDAQMDAVSQGYAEWVVYAQRLRITQPGVSIRHSPSPNDTRVIQEFDKSVGGDNVVRVDFRARSRTGRAPSVPNMQGVGYRSPEFYAIRDKMIDSLPTVSITPPEDEPPPAA